MKKSVKTVLIIIASVLITCVIFIAIMAVVISNVELKFEFNLFKEDPIAEENFDEDILDFLEASNIINPKDTYKKYDRDIGLFGPEGEKRYVYYRENGSYYYVEINQLFYYGNGEFMGYNYRSGEVFYLISVQDCEYNESAQSMDERITQTIGDVDKYIVSGEKDNYKIMECE